MIIQSEWSQILEQENESELISNTIFKHKMAELFGKSKFIQTTGSRYIEQDRSEII